MSRPCITHHAACDCREAKFADLANFFAWAMRNGPWADCSLDGGEIQDKAAELGLIVETTYDPGIHGENDIDARKGDAWFVLSPAIAELVERHRGEGRDV